MSDITVTTTEGGVTVVTDRLGAATAAAAAAVSAAAAATSASNASTSASNAASSASAASTSANTATTQAGNASTSASAASSSASAAAGSASAASTSASNASSSASAASTSASTATTQASNASTSASNASSSASAAASSAASAATAAVTEIGAGDNDAAFASMALAAIDRTVFAATIVDTFLYDTSKDSDGGAWRHRCGHTSWEAETLSGNWLGSAANETAARAISGATTGSYYYDTTAAGFYTLNAGSGKTATYRGNVRKFPAQVLITVETGRVILWDLTQAACPMWMVFAVVSSNSSFMYAGNGNSAVAACNGVLALTQSAGGLAQANFVSDSMQTRLVSGSYPSTRNIASRHSAWATTGVIAAGAIVATNSNDVAMTVLPNAPVDVATGLPVPTIAVATNGGVSVIQNDGTVTSKTITQLWSATSAASYFVSFIAFTKNKDLVFNYQINGAGGYGEVAVANTALTVLERYGADYTNTTSQLLSFSPHYSLMYSRSVVAAKNEIALGLGTWHTGGAGAGVGLGLVHGNPASVGKGLLAQITKDYNSGWMPGDIRGAWLADTVAETVTGTELVTNGTFTTDTTGWSAGVGATIAAVAGELEVTATGAATSTGYQTLTTVVGKTYVLSGTFRAPAANTGVNMARARVYDVPALNTLLGAAYVSGEDATTPFAITFTATATNTTINFDVASSVAWGSVGDKAYFDNVSCRLAAVDRSVKAKGLQIFGSPTKAAVASGSQLVGYSGFSAANYFEQPYNSDLDFGTGDFCIMGWLNEVPNSSTEVLFSRGYYSGSFTGGGLWWVRISSTGYMSFLLSDDNNATGDVITSTNVVDDSMWKLIAIVRRGSALEMWWNGAKAASDVSIVAAAASVSNTSATLRFGLDQSGSYGLTNGTTALWRASATAPTAEQIKHIYETERPLFEANAQCCLAGTSNAITALAFDEETDLLHVGTSYGRSAFKGLVRVSSEATPVGAITALSAGAGIVVQGGASGADVYVPAYTLREELLRDAEQMAKFGQNLIAHDFTATASQEVFTLPVGWEIVAVYQQGTLKRETTAWVKTFDGFKWSVDLVTGATVSDWISILAKRV